MGVYRDVCGLGFRGKISITECIEAQTVSRGILSLEPFEECGLLSSDYTQTPRKGAWNILRVLRKEGRVAVPCQIVPKP